MSGGGRGIERVDVSIDGGKTWVEASKYQKSGIPYISDDESGDKWAWVLFQAEADILQSTEIVAKAVRFTLVLQYYHLVFTSSYAWVSNDELIIDQIM